MRLNSLRQHGRSILVFSLVFACGALGENALKRRGAAREIGAHLPLASSPVYSAFLVMRPGDCDGNLDVLDLFDREPVRKKVHLGAILILGSSSLSYNATNLLRSRGVTVTVQRADEELHRRLAESGWRHTPMILITDRAGVMRAAFSTPSTVAEELALASFLQSLSTVEFQ